MGQLNGAVSWCLRLQIHLDRSAEHDAQPRLLLIREQLFYGSLSSALIVHA